MGGGGFGGMGGRFGYPRDPRESTRLRIRRYLGHQKRGDELSTVERRYAVFSLVYKRVQLGGHGSHMGVFFFTSTSGFYCCGAVCAYTSGHPRLANARFAWL